MSVFDLPRVHFAGVATTKLPTGPRSGLVDLATNRALTEDGPYPAAGRPADYHAYLERWGPRYDASGRPDDNGLFTAGKGWNFNGNGHFWIDARVTCVEAVDGVDRTDSLVGRAVDLWGHYNEYLGTTANRARIFDLDPTSNWTTVMVGQVGIGRDGRSHDTGYMVVGDVAGIQPPRWQNADFIGDVGAHWGASRLRRSTVYQFVVRRGDDLHWLDVTASPAARSLRETVDSPAFGGLVVQFALANMAVPEAPDAPNRCAVWGTIAGWRPDELCSYPAGRLLTRRGAGHDDRRMLHNLAVSVRPERVCLNMITAVPRLDRGTAAGPGPLPALGTRADLGDLELRTAATDTLVARIPRAGYRSDTFDQTSGVVTVPTLANGPAVRDEALRLVGHPAGRRTVLLAEEEVNLQVDDAIVVLDHPKPVPDHDDRVEVAIRSFVRGGPGPVPEIHVHQYGNPRSRRLDPDGARDIVRLRAGRVDTGTDLAASCVTATDAHGRGWFTVQGSRGGATRLLLSARADERPGEAGADRDLAAAYDNDDAYGFWPAVGVVDVRVLPDDWHLDRLPTEAVTFDLLYREVFAYYELLYSFMRSEVFSLADSGKVQTYARLIWQMCDPANRGRTYFMPSTRDLSTPKARLLLKYLAISRPGRRYR